MTTLLATLQRLAADLEDEGHEWALAGGLAVSARAEARFVRDIDFAVPVNDDAKADALIAALVARGYVPLMTVEQVKTRRLALVRLIPPGGSTEGPVADLLLASSGIEAELVSSASVIEVLPLVRVPTASLAHLVALKILTRDDKRRPQDRADLAMLLRHASQADIDDARAGLHLITARGYQREKDLQADLDSTLAELGRS